MSKKLLVGLSLGLVVLAGCAGATTEENEAAEEVVSVLTTETETETDTNTEEAATSEVVEEEPAAETAASTGVTLASFDRAAYDQAVADGKAVFVDFHADWCSTCKANAPAVKSALQEVDGDNYAAFQANFDTETELKKELGVTTQSTLVLVQGTNVAKLGPGPQQKDGILAFLRS